MRHAPRSGRPNEGRSHGRRNPSQCSTALGRVAHFELASLKRTYKNAGMNEAAIHAIIPNRPLPKKKPVVPPPADPPK